MTVGAWHVAFTPPKHSRHCLAFGYEADCGVWIVIEHHLRCISVRAMDAGTFDDWMVEFRPTADIWSMERKDRTSVLSPGLWCVGTAKRLLGLRSGALSPAGLRRDMIRAGATRTFAR